jgi:hypothetical protein
MVPAVAPSATTRIAAMRTGSNDPVDDLDVAGAGAASTIGRLDEPAVTDCPGAAERVDPPGGEDADPEACGTPERCGVALVPGVRPGAWLAGVV